MSRLLPFFVIAFLVQSCTSETEPGKPNDSVPDTTHVTPVKIDSAIIDTANVKHDTDSTTPVTYDCSILNKKIADLNNDKQVRRDLTALGHCGLDSFEIVYVVPNLFPGYAGEQQTLGKSVTYNDFLKHMHEFELTDSYVKLKSQVKTLDSLRATKCDVNKIYTMKPVLGRLGFTADEWDMFEGFVKTYPIPSKNYTWGQLLDDFEKYSANTPQ